VGQPARLAPHSARLCAACRRAPALPAACTASLSPSALTRCQPCSEPASSDSTPSAVLCSGLAGGRKATQTRPPPPLRTQPAALRPCSRSTSALRQPATTSTAGSLTSASRTATAACSSLPALVAAAASRWTATSGVARAATRCMVWARAVARTPSSRPPRAPTTAAGAALAALRELTEAGARRSPPWLWVAVQCPSFCKLRDAVRPHAGLRCPTGNAIEDDGAAALEGLLFARLVALNSPIFDFQVRRARADKRRKEGKLTSPRCLALHVAAIAADGRTAHVKGLMTAGGAALLQRTAVPRERSSTPRPSCHACHTDVSTAARRRATSPTRTCTARTRKARPRKARAESRSSGARRPAAALSTPASLVPRRGPRSPL
jgi:hypothetical protein